MKVFKIKQKKVLNFFTNLLFTNNNISCRTIELELFATQVIIPVSSVDTFSITKKFLPYTQEVEEEVEAESKAELAEDGDEEDHENIF